MAEKQAAAPTGAAGDESREPQTAEELQAAQQQSDEEFEAAFAEEMTKRGAPTSEPAPAASEEAGAEPGASEGKGNEAAAGAAAPEAGAEGGAKPGADKTAGKGGEKEIELPDAFKEATPAVQAEVRAILKEKADLEHFKRSNAGREAQRMRQIANLETELANLRKAHAAPSAAAPAAAKPNAGAAKPAAGKPAANAAGSKDPEIAKLLEDYPEVAGPIIKLIEQRDGQINDLQQKLDGLHGTVAQRETEEHVNAQEAAVTEADPDWYDLLGVPDHSKLPEEQRQSNANDFVAWLSTQPKTIQDIAVRNDGAIVNAEEASWMIRQYKADLARRGLLKTAQEETGAEGGKPASDANPKPAPAAPQQRPLDPKRQHQLRSATAVRNGGVAPAGGPAENDFEGSFKHFATQIDKRKAARA